jgi:hypothetical protein
MNIKKLIAKWLKITEADVIANNLDYIPKKFGESRSVEYEFKGLADVFCKVTKWSNGEGYDISFETDKLSKRIELHVEELDTLFYCLNDLKHFDL